MKGAEYSAAGRIGLAEYALVAVVAAFVLLKMAFSFPRFSDGNAYMYMASLVGEGAVPYRDFFLASPPLIVYAFALFGKVFGFRWEYFNYLPVLFSAIDALVIYLLFRNVFGKLARLSAAVVYLFSFAVLATSDFYSGVHMALALALLGTLAIVRRWPFLGGVLLGLAVLGKLYMVVMFGALVMYLLFRRKWSDGGRSLAGFLVVVGATCLFFGWLAGQQFWQAVFFNHWYKVEGIPKWRVVKFFALHDWWLLLGVLPTFVWRRFVPGIILLPILFWLVFILTFSDIYYLYFKMLVVWLALWWGWNVAQAGRRWPGLKTAGVVSVLLVAAVATGVWQYLGQQARAAVITDVDDIVASVERLTGEGEFIYGDYTITPLLALEAGIPVFKDYVDVNPMYFDVGIFDYGERAEELKNADVNTVITRALVLEGGRGWVGAEQVLPVEFFNNYCRVARAWPIERDYSYNAVVIWRCEY